MSRDTKIYQGGRRVSKRYLLLSLPLFFFPLIVPKKAISYQRIDINNNRVVLNKNLVKNYLNSSLLAGFWGTVWGGMKSFGSGFINIPSNIINSIKNASWLKLYGTFFGIASVTLEIITLTILFKKTSSPVKQEKNDADRLIEETIDKDEGEEKEKKQEDLEGAKKLEREKEKTKQVKKKEAKTNKNQLKTTKKVKKDPKQTSKTT